LSRSPNLTRLPSSRPRTDDEDEDEGGGEEGGKRRQTRSQRLKAARDAWQARATEAEERAKAAEAKAAKYESDATEGAAVGLDLYIQTIDDRIKAKRADYNAAFDAGDRDKVWEAQQELAELVADKKLAEKERRTLPPRRASSGGEVQQQTPATTAPPPQSRQTGSTEPGKPSPEAMAWYEDNKDWFNRDAIMTQVARVVDEQMVQEGFSPTDSDYFNELDKRLRTELPHKFNGRTGAKPKAGTPTIQPRAGATPAGDKIRVQITAADREMANHLGLDITTYAREKAKRERAMNTPNQYTEIL